MPTKPTLSSFPPEMVAFWLAPSGTKIEVKRDTEEEADRAAHNLRHQLHKCRRAMIAAGHTGAIEAETKKIIKRGTTITLLSRYHKEAADLASAGITATAPLPPTPAPSTFDAHSTDLDEGS